MGYFITEGYDRTTCNPFKHQSGYIEVVVEPLMAAWTDFLPLICKTEVVHKGLDENKKLILQKIKETENYGPNNNQDMLQNSDEMDVDT